MKIPDRRALASGITAISLLAVVTGVAAAQPTDAPADAETAVTDDDDDIDHEDDDDDDDVDLNGSIQMTEDESLADADEATALAALDGLISEADAIAAATADGGTAGEVELENENGSVVWEIEVTLDDGTIEEVAVDAGNGDILLRELED